MVIRGKELLKISYSTFEQSLDGFAIASESQKAAWQSTYSIFRSILNENQNFFEVDFIFEYKIPISDGKKPDVLLFIKDVLYIIEYKNRSSYFDDDIKQVKEYKDLIENYHSEGHKYDIRPILLINSDEVTQKSNEGVLIVSKKHFINEWSKSNVNYLEPIFSTQKFLSGRYNPSKDIISYARDIFLKKDIKGIEHPIFIQTENAFKEITNIIGDAKLSKTHVLVLITGEAGSGKSALALKVVKQFEGAYITKNPKFLQLLRSQLNHHVNLHAASAILKELIENERTIPQNVIVIDEAQRAYGEGRIREYYDVNESEYYLMLKHIESLKDWSCTVVFLGLNQQLASYETTDYGRWVEAFCNTKVHNSNKRVYYSRLITNLREDIYKTEVESFHLNNSLRNFCNSSFCETIDFIIESPNNPAIKKRIINFRKDGLKLMITRDIDNAANYIISNYPLQQFSSSLIGTPGNMVNYDDSTNLDVTKFLNSEEINYDMIVENRISHYHTLGLEFKLPIIIWNEDYLYYKKQWQYDILKKMVGYGFFYIRNAYRVLMTRGRDGMILYFPNSWICDSTYEYFKSIGFSVLKNSEKE